MMYNIETSYLPGESSIVFGHSSRIFGNFHKMTENFEMICGHRIKKIGERLSLAYTKKNQVTRGVVGYFTILHSTPLHN